VATEEQNGAESADDWLIETSRRPVTEPEPSTSAADFVPEETGPAAGAESIGPETEQWLVPADAGRNGRAAKGADVSAAHETDAAKPPRQAESRAAPASGKRGDSKKLQQAKQALEEQRQANSDLAKRIRDLQTELRVQAKDARSELAQALKERDAEAKTQLREAEAAAAERISELEAALAEAKKATASRSREKSGGRATKSTTARRTAASKGKLELNEAKFEELRDLGLSVTQSARLIAYRDVRGGYESLDELDNVPGLPRETLADLRARLTVSS